MNHSRTTALESTTAPKAHCGVLGTSLQVLFAMLLLAGCVSNKPASYLVPNLGSSASLVAEGVIVPCSFVTNNYELWFKGDSDSNCIEPQAQRSSNTPIIKRLKPGTELNGIRSLYANGVDSAYCLLATEVAGHSQLYIWDIHVERLLGMAPNPKRKSWYCHTGRGHDEVRMK